LREGGFRGPQHVDTGRGLRPRVVVGVQPGRLTQAEVIRENRRVTASVAKATPTLSSVLKSIDEGALFVSVIVPCW